MKKSLNRAVIAVGGESELSRILGVSRQAIHQWKRVPASRVIAVEAATKGLVTREQLRPDIYPSK